MRPFRFFLSSTIAIWGLAAANSANAGPCAGGGTLTITASADSLTVTPTAATTFNFGEHVILTAAVSGFTIMSYSWSIDGPTIKDYSETLGTQNSPPLSAASPWSTTALGSADLTGASVSFYWVPSAAQFEPNNGPFTRNVTLNVTQSGGGSCSATAALTVERNESDITRQAEDFYTSNHRAATETNPLGRTNGGRTYILAREHRRRPIQLPRLDGISRLARGVHPPFRSVAAGIRLQPCRALVSGPRASDRSAIRRRRGPAQRL